MQIIFTINKGRYKIPSLVYHTMSLKQIHPSPLVLEVVLASVSQDKTVNSSIVAPRNYFGELEKYVRTLPP